jgi:hypothetical protein
VLGDGDGIDGRRTETVARQHADQRIGVGVRYEANPCTSGPDRFSPGALREQTGASSNRRYPRVMVDTWDPPDVAIPM